MKAPLVLLHGWGVTPRIWHALREALGEIQSIAPDLAAGPGELEARADALASGLADASVLVGWSLGAMLAMAVADRHPHKVAALCLIGATPRFVRADDWPHGLDAEVVADFRQGFAKRPLRILQRFVALQLLGDRARAMLQPRLEASLCTPDAAGLEAGLEALTRADLRTRLPQQPTLLIHGSKDALMPVEAARWLAQNMPAARLIEFADAGHCPLFGEPESLAARLREFIDER